MKRLWQLAASIRTTVVLLIVMSLLLLATVIVPQRSVAGEDVIARAIASGGVQAFVLDTLGFAVMATSPVFLAALALFYVNLAAVMIDRMPSMFGRMRVRVPTPEAAVQWLASPKALVGSAEQPIDAGVVIPHLRGFGFRPSRVSSSSMYAVKHRYAAAGFLLFHVSFFFLVAGGALIWYTRFVGETRVVEGQTADAKNAVVRRRPPIGGDPDLAFTLERMTPSFDRGEATDLRAAIRFADGSAAEAWVNGPAERGAWSLLVIDVGIAPVFWLQDARGFGVDRVAAPADRGTAVSVPLASGVAIVEVQPRPLGAAFPSREALATLPLDVIIRQQGAEVFRGTLRPGEAATIRGGRVVLSEVRYWAGMKLISERGGTLLILGFVLATIGATWRLLLHRRDLVIGWDGRSFRIAGHGEWFADRDRRELMSLVRALSEAKEPRSGSEELAIDRTKEEYS